MPQNADSTQEYLGTEASGRSKTAPRPGLGMYTTVKTVGIKVIDLILGLGRIVVFTAAIRLVSKKKKKMSACN